jgi:RNA polymerase sigma-70 factor (ECF subfamily)
LYLDRHAAAVERQESLKSTARDGSGQFDDAVYRGELQVLFRGALSLQEASEVMKVSVGSARQHYERGKKRLRQLLGKALDPEPVDAECEAARVTKEGIL